MASSQSRSSNNGILVKPVSTLRRSFHLAQRSDAIFEPTVPAVIVGIALGPIAAGFLDASQWTPGADRRSAITLVCDSYHHQGRTCFNSLGFVSDCNRCAAGHCRLSATGQIPTSEMVRDDLVAVCRDDNHVALYNCVYHPNDT